MGRTGAVDVSYSKAAPYVVDSCARLLTFPVATYACTLVIVPALATVSLSWYSNSAFEQVPSAVSHTWRGRGRRLA